MSLIPYQSLIAEFEVMYHEHWRYTWGAAQKGDVDCSGAFVYAYRKFGKSIAHGSNAIARGYVEQILPISSAQPGYAAFKKKAPGQSGYDLPAKYQKGGGSYNGDLNDYYHIGLVDASGQYVLNAQGTKAGFTRTAISKWGAVGRLNAVSYKPSEEASPMIMMYVVSADGNPVKVRKSPSTSAEIVAKLRYGTEVMTGDDVNGWRPIEYSGGKGYMMAKFLSELKGPDTAPGASDTAGGDNAPAYVRTLSTAEFNALCDARDEIEHALKTLKSIVGVG